MIDLTSMSVGRSSTSCAAVDRRPQRVEVVGVVDVLHVPAVGLEALAAVLGEKLQLRRAVERDVVVVVEVDEAAEPELAGQRRGLGRHALHQVAVGDDRVDAVVLTSAP